MTTDSERLTRVNSAYLAIGEILSAVRPENSL